MIKTMQDRQPGLGTTGISGTLTITKTGTTARTATFPDAAIVVSGSAAALTPGRVPYVTTGGLLTDSSTLTASASSLSLSTTAVTGTQTILNKNANVGVGAFAEIASENDASVSLNLRSYSSASSTVRYGATLANCTLLESAGGSNAGMLIGTLANAPVIFGQNNAERFRFTSSALTSLVPVTVPNGTAAAPGIRLTNGATGLYRVSDSVLGVSVNGAATFKVYTPNGSTYGGAIALNSPSAAEGGVVFNETATSFCALAGGNSYNQGGRVLAYGQTHATKPDTVELTHGSTVKFSTNATGIGFFAATPVARPSLAAASGTATRTTFDTATVTTEQLAERVKALIDDLRGYGLEA